MSTFRSPGVYVVEDQATSMPVVGVPTGIPCFFGFTEKGRSQAPVLLTSFQQFRAGFGGRPKNENVFPHAHVEASVYAFFLNGGSQCYVCRVNGGPSVQEVFWRVRAVEGVVDYARILDDADPSSIASEAPAPAQLTVRAISAGSWANSLRIRLRRSEEDASASPTPKESERERDALALASKGLAMTFDMEVLEPVPPSNPGDATSYALVEVYKGLSTDPNDPKHFLRDGVVNGVSSRIVLAKFEEGGQEVVFGDAVLPEHKNATLVSPSSPGGAKVENPSEDNLPGAEAYERCFPLLKSVPEVSLIACPDAYSAGVDTPVTDYQPIYQAAIDYGLVNRCMVVIDPPPMAPATKVGDLGHAAEKLVEFADLFRSTHAAVYAPWFRTPSLDAAPHKTVDVPPSGFILGCYNRSDTMAGVWKAPANMPVMGAVGMQLDFTEDESETLNPAGVNLTRRFPGQGMLIWGARTTTKNVMWHYVSVGRLFLYVERTLERHLAWVEFESNDQPTWSQLVGRAEAFLRQLWCDGGLMGATAEEAFQVRCGVPQTMSMSDVQNGLLKLQVKIAPVRPAEFVVLALSQSMQAKPAT